MAGGPTKPDLTQSLNGQIKHRVEASLQDRGTGAQWYGMVENGPEGAALIR